MHPVISYSKRLLLHFLSLDCIEYSSRSLLTILTTYAASYSILFERRYILDFDDQYKFLPSHKKDNVSKFLKQKLQQLVQGHEWDSFSRGLSTI
jgi:reverse gyrase